MPKLICINDQEEFSATRATAKFCSDKCKTEYNRKKKSSKVVNTIVGSTDVETGEIMSEASEIDLDKLKDVKIPKSVRVENTPATADKNIPDALKRKYAIIKRMNVRLAAKGLPLLSEESEKVEFIPTGIDAIDGITEEFNKDGLGGIPRKHVTEIFGPSGSGKTSVMKMLAKNTEGLDVLYIDAESGLTNAPDHVTVMRTSHLEEVERLVIEALNAHEFDLIIIDSVAVLTSEKEIEGDKEGMGAKPKAMAQFGRRVNAAIKPIGSDGYPDKNAKTAVVFINQLRDTMNSFGIKEYTPGGRTIEYTASLRLELRSASAEKIKDKKTGKMIGQKIRVTVKKSRFGNIGETFGARLMYDDLK